MDKMEINVDYFIDKPDIKTKTEYQVYRINDRWFNEEGKYEDNRTALSNNSFPIDNLKEAEERLDNYLSIKDRKGAIIKREIISEIGNVENSSLLRSIQIFESIVIIKDSFDK